MRQIFLKIFDWLVIHSAITTLLYTVLTFIIFFGVGRPFGLTQSAYLQNERLTLVHDLAQNLIQHYQEFLEQKSPPYSSVDSFGVDLRKWIADYVPDLKVKIVTNSDLIEPYIWDKVAENGDYYVQTIEDRVGYFSVDQTSDYSLYVYLPLYSKTHADKINGIEQYVVPIERFVNKKTKGQHNFWVTWMLFLVPIVSISFSLAIIYLMFYAARLLIIKINFINKNFEKLVYERTKEIAGRNQQISNNLDEIKVKQEKIALDEKMATLGMVTANVATEMNLPMQTIVNFTESSQNIIKAIKQHITKAASEFGNNFMHNVEEIEENLQTIVKHNVRIEKIIETMKEQVRSKNILKTEENLGEVILKIIDKLEKSYLSGTYPFNEYPRVKLEYGQDLKSCKLSIGSFEKVIENLFQNSIYAVYERYKEDAYQKGLIEARIFQNNEALTLFFDDNGTGISEEHKSHIYQPFYTTKPTGVGIGLGLSVTYDIITKEHAGSMEIESTYNQGTHIVITIPFLQPHLV